jgi:hypothetical protein
MANANKTAWLSALLSALGWGVGFGIFALFQATIGPGGYEPRRTLLMAWPLGCVCLAPALWLSGAIVGVSELANRRRAGQSLSWVAMLGLALAMIGLVADVVVVLVLANPPD